MLQFIRDKAQGWIAWVIVGLICIPFALWGVQEYMGVDPNISVAEINGEELSLERYRQAYQRNRAQLQVAVDDPALEARLKLNTVERLVQDEIIVQTALGNGLRVSDDQLTLAIQAQQSFQADGKFSSDLYKNYVRNQGFTPGSFEFNYRRTLLAEQLFGGLVDTAFATSSEVDAAAALQTQQRTYATLRLSAETYAPASVSDADAQRYFDANNTGFRSPEQIKLHYVVLSKKALEADVKVPHDALQALYDSRKISYTKPEERRASHILVAVGRDADADAVTSAEKEVLALLERLQGGEAFATVAKAASADTVSGAKGGDLGFFARGWMAPEFEEITFAQKLGEVSAPVRTQFGFHLIRVEEIRGGDVPAFADVKSQIEQEFRAENVEKPFYAQAENLQNLAYEQPDNLDVAADTLEVKLQTSDWLTRGGLPGNEVLGNPRVLRAAFSEDVLRGGNNSEVITLESGGAVVVIRIAEHKPEADQALDEVRDVVVAALTAERSAVATRAAGEDIVRQLRKGDAPAALANKMGLKWVSVTDAKRDDRGAGNEARSLAFKMPKPGSSAVFDGMASPSGDFIVVQLGKVTLQAGDADAVQQAKTLQNAILQRGLGSVAFQNVLDSLRESADVVIHNERF